MPAPGSATDVLRSASAIVAGTVTGDHVLHIEGYSSTKESYPNGDFIRSPPFKVGSHSWYLAYYPNGGRSQDAEYISIFLRLDECVAAPVKARAMFSLLDLQGNPVLSHNRTTALCEHSLPGQGYGFGEFIERKSLEESEHLLDDSFKIRCDVTIFEDVLTEERAVASPFVVVPPSDLHLHLTGLLMAEDGADVTFQVAGETVVAHRFLLAARSRVFKAQLFGSMKDSMTREDCIQIDDMLPQVFKALVHFIYTDSLQEMEGQEETVMAQHLLEAADRYDLQRLKLMCEDKLCRHLDVSTVATTLVLAEQHNCRGLKEACIDFLTAPDALEAVMATDSFEQLMKSYPALIKELMSKLATHSNKRRKLTTGA